MILDQLKQIVEHALEELKAEDIKWIDVRDKTTITDLMVIATGRSTRHVKAMADNIVEQVKNAQGQVLGMEGEAAADWILVDLGDVVAHIMLAETRDFYAIEKLWTVERNEAASN